MRECRQPRRLNLTHLHQLLAVKTSSCVCYKRGLTGSFSRARTLKTRSWTRRSGSWRTNLSRASMPRANSRSANERLVETAQLQRNDSRTLPFSHAPFNIHRFLNQIEAI